MKKILLLIFFSNYLLAQELPESLTLYLENETIEESELSFLYEVMESPINLNDCSAEDLLQLPLVTPSEAKAIIRYRNTKQFFRSVYELQAIEGLKRKTISLLMECVSVQPKSVASKKIRHQWTALYHRFLEEQKEFSDGTYVVGNYKNYLR